MKIVNHGVRFVDANEGVNQGGGGSQYCTEEVCVNQGGGNLIRTVIGTLLCCLLCVPKRSPKAEPSEPNITSIFICTSHAQNYRALRNREGSTESTKNSPLHFLER